jgi:plasmid stabilization system protein ParE
VTYKACLTPEAEDDLDRLYGFLLEHDLDAAERALIAIDRAFGLLAYAPFSCRKVLLCDDPRIREVVIPFGRAGDAALFEIENGRTVTVAAVRHQREDDHL